MELIRKRVGSYTEKESGVLFSEQVTEIIVPDISPDYENTISVFTTCKLNDKSVLSGSVKITGQLFSTIHYSSNASECAYTINCSDGLTHTSKCENLSPEDKIICNAEVVSSEVTIINSRKVRLTTKLCTKYYIFRFSNAEIIEDICEDVGEGIKTLTNSTSIITCVDITEKPINISEEIDLSIDERNLCYRIVRWKYNWKIDDTKVLQNKVMLRGHIEIDVYSTSQSDFTVNCKRYAIPFSQIVECKNAYEGDNIQAYLNQTHCNIKICEKEDRTILICDCCANVLVLSERNIELKYLCDAYSTTYELECKPNSSIFYKNSEPISKDFCIERKIDIKDFINQLMDCSAIYSYKISEDRGLINLNISTNMIYVDSSNCLAYFNDSFEYSIEIDSGLIDYSVEIFTENIQATVDSSGINLIYKGTCSYRNIDVKEIKSISACSIDKIAKKEYNKRGNIIIRNIAEDETIWSIAKQYSTTTDAIISANGLKDGALSTEKLIMIPLYK